MISPENFIRTTLTDAHEIKGPFPHEMNYSIDSRTLQAGDIFVALEGKHVDGHAFIADAIKNGAAGIVMADSKKEMLNGIAPATLQKLLIVMVPDVAQALIQLASAWRQLFTYPVVGVTGSVGKTSTKELIAQLLKNGGKSYVASYANQNTLYGLALNVLRMREHHQVAVFEMGINKPGEMARLAAIARPTIGVITVIGHAHMELLGSVSNIAAEKRDIFKYFKEDNIGIINGDQPLLSGVAYKHPVIKFGSKTTNQVQARKVQATDTGITCTLKWYGNKETITINKKHAGAVFNCLAVVAVAHLLEIPKSVIIDTIQESVTLKGRFEECALKGSKNILINDCYNANPESMKAALLAFQNIATSAKKVAILGDMLELGSSSPFWHRQIGRFLRKTPSIKSVVLVGSDVKWTQKTAPLGMQITHVPSWQEAASYVREQLQEDAIFLVKGSFGMQLQKMVDELIEQ